MIGRIDISDRDYEKQHKVYFNCLWVEIDGKQIYAAGAEPARREWMDPLHQEFANAYHAMESALQKIIQAESENQNPGD